MHVSCCFKKVKVDWNRKSVTTRPISYGGSEMQSCVRPRLRWLERVAVRKVYFVLFSELLSVKIAVGLSQESFRA
ncbi:hypothetical protein E2P81_ATG09962 [Venturia nashicola]|uniref:Uncharacterized protein n=1 Tax=Venturia nashicola TaxID=86259 RepID=A0A4Z1NKU1_9PEZI|nr:hypothetical protein E6O75_ATG10181 [Venturia nashicola]TLD18664.1 hypothetical protein E2P81_ATG09962 [Venturia nashicola]